jgi:hypothetical protein
MGSRRSGHLDTSKKIIDSGRWCDRVPVRVWGFLRGKIAVILRFAKPWPVKHSEVVKIQRAFSFDTHFDAVGSIYGLSFV